jgi:hypothetical protein
MVEGPQREDVLVRRVEGRPAGGEHVDVRERGEGRGQRPGGRRHVFAVVEDDQHREAAQGPDDALVDGRLELGVDVQCVGHRGGDLGVGLHSGELGDAHTIPVLVPHVLGDLEGESGLADPARPGDRRAPRPEQGPDRRQLAGAADEGAVGEPPSVDRTQGVQRREVSWQVGVSGLVDPSPREVLEHELAEIEQFPPRGELAAEQGGREVGDQDLATMTRLVQAPEVVERGAAVLGAFEVVHAPGVDADAHPQLHVPRGREQLALDLAARFQRLARSCEQRRARVPFTAEDVGVPRREGGRDELVVQRHHPAHRRLVAVPVRGAQFDVGEDEAPIIGERADHPVRSLCAR